MRTAESVVLTLCPPGPEERKTSMRMSVSGMSMWSVDSMSGMTSTAAKEVWRRPWVVEGADAHQAVCAALDAQGPVGIGGVDLEGDRLQARLLGVGGVENLDGVLVPLGPAGVHAQEHLGEVGGVHTAGARADGDDGVARGRTRR